MVKAHSVYEVNDSKLEATARKYTISDMSQHSLCIWKDYQKDRRQSQNDILQFGIAHSAS